MRLNEISKSAKPIHKIISPGNNKILRKECSLFLNNSTKPLYRGVTGSLPDSLYKVTLRKNRRPLNSSRLGTAFFNMLIEQKFKIPNIRNQSAFLSVNSYVAQSFGQLAFVIPTDACQFIWNPAISDSTSDFNLDIEISDVAWEYPTDYYNIQERDKKVEIFLDKIIRNAESPGHNLLKGLDKKELVTIEKFIESVVWTEMQSYKYAKEFTSEVTEGSNRHEVLMFGTPHYYLVSVEALLMSYGDEMSRQNAFNIMKKQILTGK